jgi:hypothetical protein
LIDKLDYGSIGGIRIIGVFSLAAGIVSDYHCIAGYVIA